MANSVYISKHLTSRQLQFMKLLDEFEILYFRMEDIEEKLKQKFPNLNEVLENLVDKGLLARIERGKYRRHDFADSYVLASFISQNGVVAYWSALHLHNLTERFPNKIFIKGISRKRNKRICGTNLQFVTVQKYKMAGIEYSGYGDTRYPLTDIEMTLLDCFDQPVYAGDWPDLIRALYNSSLNSEKLMKYASLYKNASVVKRMGYLIELFDKKDCIDFIDFAQVYIKDKYTLFYAAGANAGSFNSRWKLRMNIDKQSILDIIQTPY